MSYDAFVSYSHAADGRLAPAIQAGLQRLAKPWYRLRALRIFRDETGLSTNPHLWSSIETALESSEWFILLASPEAARSPWVNKEIQTWLATKPADRILAVVTSGGFSWDPSRNDFAVDATAAPCALHGVFESEPRYLDLRWARTRTDLDLRNSRFRDAVADLAAPLHGVAKDELESEDIRQYRHTRRLARGGVTTLALLLVISLVASVVALDQRNTANRQRDRANEQARIADARRLAAQAVAGANVELDRSLLLALEARRLRDSPETRGALLTTVSRSRNLRFTLRGFGHEIDAACLSPDGRTLLMAGSDSVLRIVDVATRRVTSTLRFESLGRATSIALHAQLVAVATERGTIGVYDLSRGRLVRSALGLEAAPIRAIAFSPDGRDLAARDDQGVGALWSVPSLEERGRFTTYALPEHYDVAFSSDGRLLAVSGAPGFVLDVATATPTYPRQLASDVSELEAGVAFSPDRQAVAVAHIGQDAHRIVFLDAMTGRELRAPLAMEGGPVGALAYSPDGHYLAGARSDGIVLLWNLAERQPAPIALIGNSARAEMLAFAPAGDAVFAASKLGIAAWSISTESTLWRKLDDPGAGGAAALVDVGMTPDGRTVVMSDMFGRLTAWDTATGHLRFPTIQAAPRVGWGATGVALSPDGRSIAVAASDGTVTLWDSAAGRRLRAPLRIAPSAPATMGIVVPGTGVTDVVFDAVGATVIASTGTGELVRINVSTWSVVRRIRAHRPVINMPIAISTDGRLVATAAEDGVTIHDVASGRRLASFSEVSYLNIGVIFSPDGRSLAAGFSNGTILLIDVAHRRVAHRLVINRGQIGELAYSPDGKTLAAGSRDGTLTLWDVTSGQMIGEPLPGQTDQVIGVAYTPDGTKVAAASYDGTGVLYDVDVRSWSRRACELAGRNLTRAEWAQYLTGRPYHRTCAQWP